jgi:hypothetical protein
MFFFFFFFFLDGSTVQCGPSLPYFFLGFLTVDFFWGGVVSPTPDPNLKDQETWRLGAPVIPPGTEYPF